MARRTFDDRWGLVAVIVTEEATDLLCAGFAFGTVVVTTKTLDRRHARQRLGAVIVAAFGWLALGHAPFEAEDLLPIDRVDLSARAEAADDDGQHNGFPLHIRFPQQLGHRRDRRGGFRSI